MAPDVGGAYYNLYGANYDISNKLPFKAPGPIEYNNAFSSSAFFGVPPQDMPTVCLQPAVEFSYLSRLRGQQHTNKTNASNTNFTVFNPSMLIYTSTTTTTSSTMFLGFTTATTTTTFTSTTSSSLLPYDVAGPSRIVVSNRAHLGPFKIFVSSHRFGLNITVGVQNRQCHVIYHKDNYVRCVHPATDTVALRSPYNPLMTAPVSQNDFELNPRRVVLHDIDYMALKNDEHQRQTIKVIGRSTEGVTAANVPTPDDEARRRELGRRDEDEELISSRWISEVDKTDVVSLDSPEVLARLRALEEQRAQGFPSDFDLQCERRVLEERRGTSTFDDVPRQLELQPSSLPSYVGGLPYMGEDVDGGKDSRLWDLDRGIVSPIASPAVQRQYWFLDVKIRICPKGTLRGAAGAFKCVPCPRGTYSTYGRGSKESEENLKMPIECRNCWSHQRGRYQDEEGAAICKLCPMNSISTPRATARVDDCRCEMGYFTPYYGRILKSEDDPTYVLDAFKWQHLAGYPCVSCARLAYGLVMEFTEEKHKYMDKKWAAPPRFLCDAFGGLNFVPDGLCMAYCEGGTTDVVAQKHFFRGMSPRPLKGLGLEFYRDIHKEKFYGTHYTPDVAVRSEDGYGSDEVKPAAEPQPTALSAFAPLVEVCVPPAACLGYNICGRAYIENFCVGCRFKYFRNNKQICIACGFAQVVASLLMTGLGTFACVGGFAFMVISLKFKSDLQFKIVIKLVVKVRIIKPLLREYRYYHGGLGKGQKGEKFENPTHPNPIRMGRDTQ